MFATNEGGKHLMKIEFYRHNISQKDIDNAVKVLNSVFLTTGETVAEFEKRFSQYLGCKYTIGVTSCTAALHLSLLAYGIGPGDEVITTPMTFIATANTVLHAGATPVFVDVEPDTANINADLVEKAITSRTKAILPVHLHGQMCDMNKIREIANKHHLILIEDAAHAIEASREGIRPGELGDAACFSFYATKNITSGEGGAVSTNNKEIAEKLKKLRLHGMSKGAAERYVKKYEHWDMEMLGWKYNMDNIQAALLLNQLESIEKYWQWREEICRMYEEAFKDNPQVTCLKVLPGSKSGRHMFTILVSPEKRDSILWQLQERGIGVAVHYRAIHLLTFYRQTYGYERGMFPIAEKIGDSTVTLPLYPKLSNEEVQYVIKGVKEVTTG
jgi:dTDP-4-amino-4,6-dideoxygalactose transaminase